MVRLKHRYLVVYIGDTNNSKPAQLNESTIWFTIYDKVRYLHGPFGEAATQSGFCVKYVNKHTGIAVIRSRRGPHRLIASALPLVSEIKKEFNDDTKGNMPASKISISTLYTGACIKQCLIFIKQYQMDEYHKAASSMCNADLEQLKRTYMSCQFVGLS